MPGTKGTVRAGDRLIAADKKAELAAWRPKPDVNPAGKLDRESASIEAARAEASEKHDAAMNAATQGLVMGAASGAIRIGGAAGTPAAQSGSAPDAYHRRKPHDVRPAV